MIGPGSIHIDNKVSMNYDSKLEIQSNMVFNTVYLNLELFGDYYGPQVNDFQVSSIITLVCNLNTIECYWEELKKQILSQPSLLQDILPNSGMGIEQIDAKHKSWFRDTKLNKILDNE